MQHNDNDGGGDGHVEENHRVLWLGVRGIRPSEFQALIVLSEWREVFHLRCLVGAAWDDGDVFENGRVM